MEYSINCELSENIKKKISEWLNKTLLDYMEEECDEVFIEYILVMIINKKTMAEISTELEAFIGENACSELALRIGEQLRSFIQTEEQEGDRDIDYEEDVADDQEKSNNNNDNNNNNNSQGLKGKQSSRIINLNRNDKNKNPRLSEGLKSSRDKDGSTRLVQTALKNTLGTETQENKKGKNPRTESQGQVKDQKRQRIVQIQDGRGKGFITSHHTHNTHNNNNNNNSGMNMNNYNNNFNSDGLDPQTLMHIQAQNAGYANIEEMMNAYFQKNMLAMMQNMNNPIGAYGIAPALPPPENFGVNQGYMPGMMQPTHFPPPSENLYPYSYPPTYHERGRGRSGRVYRGNSQRGRGFHPTLTGRGRGIAPSLSDTMNGTSTETTSTIVNPTPTTNTLNDTNSTTYSHSEQNLNQNQTQNQNQGGESEVQGNNDANITNDNTTNTNANVNIESNQIDNNSSIPNLGRGGFRGRFRGRETLRGRGRFAGRIIRGRNKTWVRGPGTENPLVTER